MNQKTITTLNVQDFKVLKHIQIIADRKYNESVIGNIFYRRDFSMNYKIKEEKNENESNRIERLLNEYPKQENYPKDRIDDIIFNSIKEIYPKSIVRNSLIIFNTDLERLEILKNRNKISGKIFFTPTYEDFSNLSFYAGKSYISPVINLNVYSDYVDEIREGQGFSSKYFFGEEGLIEKIKLVEFE